MSLENLHFATFKNRVYERIKDLHMLDVLDGEVNLLKVVLDGLKVRYTSKGKIRPLLILPTPERRLFYAMSVLRGRRPSAYYFDKGVKDRVMLIDSGGRMVSGPEGEVSFHFNRITDKLGANRFLLVGERVPEIRESYFPVNVKYNAADLMLALKLSFSDDSFETLRKGCAGVLKKLSDTGLFEQVELNDIKVGMHYFLMGYLIWKHILTKAQTKKTLLTVHYHKEGCIYAMRELGIHSIELQHGLIATQDIFYCFPDQVEEIESKILMCDEIMVFGEFWRRMLLRGKGYSLNQISVLGEYRTRNASISKEEKQRIASFTENRKVILVTTQTSLHNEFSKYISFLAGNEMITSGEYCIIVKHHPAENINSYDSILNLQNVLVVGKFNIDFLYQIAQIHISCYSTTLFESIAYHCVNFSLLIPECMDYVKRLLDDGVSKALPLSEIPDVVNLDTTGRLNVDEFYAPLNWNMLEEKLQ
jgi:hypothetical protein